MVAGLRWAVRAATVFAAAGLMVLAGQLLLRGNAMVRPMWTGPNAITIARTQLTRAEAAVATTQQEITQLQAQTQQASANANALSQVVGQAGTAGVQGDGGFGGFRRDRGRGGDDGGRF